MKTRRIAIGWGMLLVSLVGWIASSEAQGDAIADSASATPSTQPSGASGNSADLTNMSLEDLMNVEVTSVSKKSQSIAEAPAAVSVISQDDIARSDFSSIPDMLRMAPGVDVARVNSQIWAVGVRGLNDEFTNNLLVVQDGRTLYTPFFGGVVWDTVDYVAEDLDRIEVIRGPGGTLWGANAVNGVINITSKDSRDTQGLLVSTRGSNVDSNLAVRYGGRLSDDTTYRVYFKTQYNNEFDTPTGENAGDEWYSLRSGFRIDKHPTDANTFTVQGDYGNNQMREPLLTPIPTAPFVMPQTIGRYDTTGNLLTRWEHRDSDDSDFTLQAYYDYLSVFSYAADYTQNTVDLDFHHRFKLTQNNEVTWGLGYRIVNTDLGETPVLIANPSSRNLNLYSAFVQDTYTIQPDHWFFTAGSKFEHNDMTGYEVLPSARLMWTPNKQNSVWGSISRAVSTPTLLGDSRVIEAYTDIPVGPGVTAPAQVTVIGNPHQRSEELVAYELGYRVQATKRVSADLAMFYNSYDRVETISSGAPIIGSPIVLPQNVGNDGVGFTYGGELSITVEATDKWRLQGSYSLLEASFRARDSVSMPLSENNSAPRNQAQIRSYYDVTKNVQFNAAVFYVDNVGEYHIPSYISTDLNVGWQPKESMNFKVGVLNLFDNAHPEFGVTGGQVIASETPRTVYAEISYKY
jgi:iron complex outermembrane recepter protein